jgi:hypothetical protein
MTTGKARWAKQGEISPLVLDPSDISLEDVGEVYLNGKVIKRGKKAWARQV